jgi:monoamine oxidase
MARSGDRSSERGPGAGSITRRLFLNGGLKATLAAGLASRYSLLNLLAGAPPARSFDGELLEESYDIAHRLRDGTLQIPSLTPEGPLHDAIVVGVGVSGLMAAWELERGGLADVLLFEKEDFTGGNASKGHANGTDYTRATWSLVRPRDEYMNRLVADLGIIDGFTADGKPKFKPIYVGPGPEYNNLIDGNWYRGGASDGHDVEEVYRRMPLPAKVREDEIAFRREMLEWEKKRGKDGKPAFAMPVEDGSRDPDILALDHVTMEEYARRKGWGQRTLDNIHEYSAGTIGGGIGEVSAYGFLSFNSLGQGGEDITLPGGNTWLAERLLDKVGRERVHTERMAVRVENHGDEVRLTFVDPKTGRFEMRRARSVVLACQKHITGRIVPEMNTPDREGYKQFQYGALLMGEVHVQHTPVLKGGVPLAWYQGTDGRFIGGFLVNDYNSERWRKGDPRRPNVLSLWTPLAGKATRVDLLEKPWSHWADKMADDLEFMIPGLTADITRLDICVWGHHMVIPYPGFLTGDMRRTLCRPLGRITFAHSDRHGMPSFELAARAGSDAAREAIAIVKGNPPAA